MKDKISGVGFLRLDSYREPDLSGLESDMYTVQARSKICPCVPPCTPTGIRSTYNPIYKIDQLTKN